jgi:hypothetical protein
MEGRFVLQAKSISEAKRVRYLLGRSFPGEREQIESEYFEDDDAFQQMLIAEDDLVDAYAHGELVGEERVSFEKRFASSRHGKTRVQFARAFASAVSDTQPIKTKPPATFFTTFQSRGLLRIAAVIILVAVLALLISDRRRMTNKLRELRAESAKLSKRIEVLQRSGDTERTRATEVAAQLANLRPQPDKSRHRQRVTTDTQRVPHLSEEKNDPEKFALRRSKRKGKVVNTQDASVGNTFAPNQVTELPLNARNVPSLLTLQPATTRGDYTTGRRSDQTNETLDAVEGLKNGSPPPRNTISSGISTISGTAKDPQGKVVSGATVTLTDSARNFTRTQSTNKDGAYVFNSVPPGTYSIEVKAPGFKTASASGLAALVNTPTFLDVQLEVGAVTERVDVTSSAEAFINRNDATLGNTFEQKRITELPLNANNVVGLLSLQPGVNRTGSVNGARADQSNITLDGVDLNTLNTYSLTPRNTNSGDETSIQLPSFLSWVRFRIVVETAAVHEEYRVTIKTADGHAVLSVDWIESLTPNQTNIDTPAISTSDLPSGNYVLLLMGKEPNGSFINFGEYAFKVIKH